MSLLKIADEKLPPSQSLEIKSCGTQGEVDVLNPDLNKGLDI